MIRYISCLLFGPVESVGLIGIRVEYQVSAHVVHENNLSLVNNNPLLTRPIFRQPYHPPKVRSLQINNRQGRAPKNPFRH